MKAIHQAGLTGCLVVCFLLHDTLSSEISDSSVCAVNHGGVRDGRSAAAAVAGVA